MSSAIDHTHDPERRSWVASANGHPDFPIQNLPVGVFAPPGNTRARGGVAIGDEIVDLDAAREAGLLTGLPGDAGALASADTLNSFFAAGPDARRALRFRLFELLSAGSGDESRVAPLLHPAAACALTLPARVGDYTDFYAGIHHATNVGSLFRPDTPLLPNYKYVPIGYHGRSSSICVSGTPVRRPHGQLKPAAETVPSFAPSRSLDYELELGIWIGPGNELGEPIPIGRAADHIAGFCLLNDWSARDIQGWEYQPLGPFLAKSFATTVSPWVVTAEALAPFRIAQPPRPPRDPGPLPYLLDTEDQQSGALDLELDVLITTDRSRAEGASPARLASSNTRHLYWTIAQLITHHTSNGCNLRPGDLLGTGTISADTPEGLGSLLELTRGAGEPVTLPWGETRRFLDDGDEVVFRARAQREGFASIGFGQVAGKVMPAE